MAPILASLMGIATSIGLPFFVADKTIELEKKNKQKEMFVDSIKRKLNISFVDKKDSKGRQWPEAWSIDSKDFAKIDSLYNEVIKKHPESKIDSSSKVFSFIKTVKPEQEGYPAMQSLERSLKLNSIADAISKNTEKK